MADKIKVDTNKLYKTRNNINSQLQTVRKQLMKMRMDIIALGMMWEGPAHTTFQSSFQNDLAYLDKVCNNLDRIINFETNAAHEYNICEQKVETLVNQIKI